MFESDSEPKKAGKKRGKTIDSVSFSPRRSLCTVILEQPKIIDAEWYTTISLHNIFEKFSGKRPRSCILLHHDKKKGKRRSYIYASLHVCNYVFWPQLARVVSN